jgi:hypothetical protein
MDVEFRGLLEPFPEDLHGVVAQILASQSPGGVFFSEVGKIHALSIGRDFQRSNHNPLGAGVSGGMMCKISVSGCLGLERSRQVLISGRVKMKYNMWCLGSALVLGAVSCKEKPKATETPAAENSVVEAVVEAVKETVAPVPAASLSVEERAAKLGFAKHLPADTELVMSIYNTEQAAEQLKALKLYGFFEEMQDAAMMDLQEEMLEDVDVPEEDIIEEEDVLEEAEQGEDDLALEEAPFEEGMGEGPSPWTLLGREITIAMGKSTGEQTAHLLTMNRRMGYFQAKAFGKAVQVYAKSGDMEEFSSIISEEMEEGLLKNMLEDPESGIALLEKAEMPPLYIAFRAKDGELEQAAQLVNGSMGMFAMAGEMAVPVEFESGGSNFAGYKLLGSKIVEMMEADRESMDEAIGAKSADGVIAALGKKNLIVATGTIGEYVVMMIGGSEESLKLAADAKDSLVGTDSLNFADAYADKKLLTLIYGEKEMWDAMVEAAGGISSYALGMRDGIAGGGGLGETRDLEGMLQIIADREKELLALGGSDDLGMVAFTEEGLKIESFGGYDKGAVDWDAKTTLSHLGDSADNMIFLNVPSNAAYDEKMGEYLEVIVETVYAATVKFAELEIDAPEMEEMRQYTKMFDTQFREDMVGLYGALSASMSDGLGHEMAFVMDLKGNMPAIPGIPQKVVDEAKAPRMTLLAPVKDRAKLKESWEKVNSHTTSLLAKVSEMTGEEMPMQKPISSEKDGMTTWFFSFPFFQDDFLPSVTVSDKWFAASTSKTQTQDLIAKANVGGAAGEGVQFRVNFNAITTYAGEMLDMVDKNSAEIFPEESALEDFNSGKEQMRKFIAACGDFDSLTWIAREEGGIMRSSIHFKTK